MLEFAALLVQVRPPNPAALSVQGGPQILEFAALIVQRGAQILEFAALSVQGDPQILAFAAFAEFPVFGSQKLNRWSAPPERDQNEMQICTFFRDCAESVAKTSL